MSNLTVKKGDTFSVLCQRVDADNNPVSISGYTIASKVNSIGSFTQSLTIGIVNAALGEFTISATATDTLDWPVFQALDGTTSKMNIVYCDVQYTLGSYVESTDTFSIYVIEDVT